MRLFGYQVWRFAWGKEQRYLGCHLLRLIAFSLTCSSCSLSISFMTGQTCISWLRCLRNSCLHHLRFQIGLATLRWHNICWHEMRHGRDFSLWYGIQRLAIRLNLSRSIGCKSLLVYQGLLLVGLSTASFDTHCLCWDGQIISQLPSQCLIHGHLRLPRRLPSDRLLRLKCHLTNNFLHGLWLFACWRDIAAGIWVLQVLLQSNDNSHVSWTGSLFLFAWIERV